MTSHELLDDTRLEAFVPKLRDDLLIRQYGPESVVWSPIGTQPLHLDPASSVAVQLLDGASSLADIAEDIRAEVGVPRSIALERLGIVVGQLDAAGALATSTGRDEQTEEHFYGPPNP